MESYEERICNHCKGKIAIRNPKGICDHLYYTESCDVCKSAGYHEKRKNTRRQEDGKFEFLMSQVQMVLRMGTIEVIRDTLKNAVDSIEKGG